MACPIPQGGHNKGLIVSIILFSLCSIRMSETTKGLKSLFVTKILDNCRYPLKVAALMAVLMVLEAAYVISRKMRSPILLQIQCSNSRYDGQILTITSTPQLLGWPTVAQRQPKRSSTTPPPSWRPLPFCGRIRTPLLQSSCMSCVVTLRKKQLDPFRGLATVY